MSIGIDYEESPFESDNSYPHIAAAWLLKDETVLVLFKTNTCNEKRFSFALFDKLSPIYSTYACYFPSAMAPQSAIDEGYIQTNEKVGVITGATVYGLLHAIELMEQKFPGFENHLMDCQMLNERNIEIRMKNDILT